MKISDDSFEELKSFIDDLDDDELQPFFAGLAVGVCLETERQNEGDGA